MRQNTKELILMEALTLFSTRGFEGVGVREIARAVQIKESSIYKHYKNKQDIFDSIFLEMQNRYLQVERALGLPSSEGESAVQDYEAMGEKELLFLAENLFLFFLQDDFACKFRRMLTIEQYRSPQASKVFQKFFMEDPIAFQSGVFEGLVQKGVLTGHPQTMALQFYSPIFFLLNKYDSSPTRLKQGLGELKQHIIEFQRCHAVKTGGDRR